MMGKGKRSGKSQFLFPVISCPKKEWKVTFCNRSFYTISLQKETTIQEGDSQVSNDWAVSIDLTDAYLHVPIYP